MIDVEAIAMILICLFPLLNATILLLGYLNYRWLKTKMWKCFSQAFLLFLIATGITPMIYFTSYPTTIFIPFFGALPGLVGVVVSAIYIISFLFIISFIKVAIKAAAPSGAAAAAAAGGAEMALLKDDILAVRGYGAMTNIVLASARPVVGDKPLRDILTEYFEYNPLLFEGCEIKDDGTIDLEPVMKNLDRISKENRVQQLCSIFSTLNSKITALYGAITSPELAKKRLEESYLSVKKQYGDLPVLFDILRTLPEGVLEEERLALLSREELEARVKERTAELEKAKIELEKAYEELKTLDKMKIDFLDLAAHELMTPLVSVKTNVEMLTDEDLGKINKEQKKALIMVDKNIDKLSTMIKDILSLSALKAESFDLKIEPVSIPDVVREIISYEKTKISEKEHNLIIDLPEHLLLVDVDRNLFIKTFKNLITNAVHYTPKIGTITVSASEEGENIHLKVSDTGIGIPKKEQEKIFEKFYQVKKGVAREYRGLGIGLSITKHIVERHNGKIWVESIVGKGSTFHVLLPKSFKTK